MKHNMYETWVTASGETNIKSSSGKTQAYHRYLVEQYFGFPIPTGFSVHHIDGDHFNNNLSNFLLIKTSLHCYVHRVGMINMFSSNLEVMKNYFIKLSKGENK